VRALASEGGASTAAAVLSGVSDAEARVKIAAAAASAASAAEEQV